MLWSVLLSICWCVSMNDFARKVAELEHAYRHAQQCLLEETAQLSILLDGHNDLLAAQSVVQTLSQEIQSQAHRRISSTVTSCLATVFGDDAPTFDIQFELKRGKTEATLVFRKGDLELDPLASSGGGVIDVAAFALRVACLMLTRPKLRKILILDEPFRFVSAGFRDNVRMLLEQLSEDMGIQIIMVTHAEDLITGNVVELN